MAYSSNIYLPRTRRNAVNLVLFEGWSMAKVSRHIGVHRSTIWRWCQRPEAANRVKLLRTRSSRPHSHPKQLTEAVVRRVLELRWELKRCAEVIWRVLQREGVYISLASVGRILARHKQVSSLYGRKGKVYHRRTPRPRVEAPGSFLEMDTIHFKDWKTKQAYYVYTLIDLKSRWAYAAYSPRISPERTNEFVLSALKAAPFKVQLVQTDNGQEFGNACEAYLNTHGIEQRRIRLGRKNDNAHIERFNRTLQDECLGRWPNEDTIQARLTAYLDFYNTKRYHLGIQCRRPMDVAKVLS
ncbi:hypothetical protein L336_0807 [Candidatus Saccharimonas aalborgensis]|uniref:Integrase catalytic domain-containing protein n=1 Tax=Candidatus Saccharimonas aalborgensis TaxID=1332188 RepID=R4PNG1_9BACT|nr:DDE-type integrase/transposase/recombinase [Candidatus Saccharimonas aalborgensis]AGL62509.1 hypothetical protein L336_0807 [Candidatus Saccharimonas aalborgensis]